MPGVSLALFADLGGMSRPKVKCYDLRSTRALRVEGDSSSSRTLNGWSGFLSTPSGWRATRSKRQGSPSQPFLSTPSGWRATRKNGTTDSSALFLSTPSGWRATSPFHFSCVFIMYFYPRPPGGGRLQQLQFGFDNRYFYPRPPGGGRLAESALICHGADFYPRPPGGGRLEPCISTDYATAFLSTPSGWRATQMPSIL